MNETINLPALIKLVAEKSGCEPAVSRRFLHDLFAVIEKSLSQGETVEVRGIGTFAPGSDITQPVLFKADEALAATANLPFSVFTAVELNDGAAEAIEAMNSTDATTPPAPSMPVVEPSVEPESVVKEAEPEKTQPEPPSVEATIEEPKKDEFIPLPNPLQPVEVPFQQQKTVIVEEEETAETEEPESDVAQESDDNKPEQPNHKLWLMLGILIGLIIGLVGGYFAGKTMAQYTMPVDDEEEYATDSLTVEQLDSIAATLPVAADTVAPKQVADTVTAKEAPTKPAQPEPVYDTVTNTRFLTAIAKEHYGVKNYWIFIYLANPQLKSPNSISPGTRVVIPPKESFAEDTEEATRAKASKLIAKHQK